MVAYIFDRPITEVIADGVILYLFNGDRPPQGVTGTIDWFLNGIISRLVHEGKMNGNYGETALITSQSRLQGTKLLLLGAGGKEQLDIKRLNKIWNKTAEIVCQIQLFDIATIIPMTTTVDAGKVVVAMLGGFLKGIKKLGEDSNKFKFSFTNFGDFKTKENKIKIRDGIKSFSNMQLIGF